jgi:hypothetical protein
MLPDFGFLTLAETERRRARRERKVGKELARIIHG